MIIHQIPEHPGVGRLGRHVGHDPKSRAFGHTATPVLTDRLWTHHGPVLDQGQIGSCTGNAMVAAKMTGPLYDRTKLLTEVHAVKVYSLSTQSDGIPGSYPPQDTGSTGLGVCKAAAKLGWIKRYTHAFGLAAALSALSTVGPVLIGIPWYEGFDRPVGATAELKIAGAVRGGHELCLLGLDVAGQKVKGVNSWSDAWGDHGYFTMSFATFDALLHDQGDATIPLMS